MDYCKSCGSEVAAGTRRCPSCGDVIDEFASETTSEGGVDLDREILALVQSDGVIAAVNRYRESTGCGLKDAKDSVERLMSGGTADPIKPRAPVGALDADILDLAQIQGKIAAIKQYREATGCGLKDAKDAVDALLLRHGVQAKGGSGCASVIVMAVVLAWGMWFTG